MSYGASALWTAWAPRCLPELARLVSSSVAPVVVVSTSPHVCIALQGLLAVAVVQPGSPARRPGAFGHEPVCQPNVFSLACSESIPSDV